MPDRDQILHNIDTLYDARIRGDKAAIGAHFAPGASFRFAGRADLIRPEVPVGPGDFQAAVHDLIDLFEFHDMERLDAVVEGDMAAVHWKFTVSTPGGEPVDSELYDLWKFDEDGKVLSLVQFADTALMGHLLDGRSVATA